MMNKIDNNSLKVLMIGTDRKLFEESSEVRKRLVKYGEFLEELHIIIFAKRKFGINYKIQISKNVFIYSTNSWSRLFYICDAIKIGKNIIKNCGGKFIVTSQDPFETGFAGWRLAKRFKLPLQIQIHTDFLNQYFWKASFLNKVRVLMAKFLLKRASCVRVVSKRIEKTLLEAKSCKLQTKIFVLPIFVDLSKFKNTPAIFDAHKKYPYFSFIILMASRLEKEKNVFLAIEIMKKLTSRYPKIGMIIVGDGRERKSLESLVKKYNLEKNVIFEGWQNNLISYYKTANVFLSTSLYEGYGLTVIEALSCGCPVISSDVGIAREMIFESESGFVCPVGDKDCFVRKITEIIETPGLKEKMVVNSKIFINEKMNETEVSYLDKYKKSLEDCF